MPFLCSYILTKWIAVVYIYLIFNVIDKTCTSYEWLQIEIARPTLVLFYIWPTLFQLKCFRCVIMKLASLCFCICANNNLNLRAYKTEIFHQYTIERHFAPFIIVFNIRNSNLAYVFKSLNAICSVYKSKPTPKSTPTSTAHSHCMVWDARLAHVNATNLITQLIIILIKSINICTARIFACMSYERLLLLLLSSNVHYSMRSEPYWMCDVTIPTLMMQNLNDSDWVWFWALNLWRA